MYEVLIVERDPMVAELEKKYISENPCFHVAKICKTAAQALDYIQNNDIHLVIFETNIGNSDENLLKVIRSTDLAISVIVITAENSSEAIERALIYGAEDYIIKPFENSRLQRALDNFCRRRKIFSDLNILSQEEVDSLLSLKNTDEIKNLPKGLQKKTMESVCRFLQNNPKKSFSGEEVAKSIGLSRVTAKRYLEHLLQTGEIHCSINYKTGGRPCETYNWNICAIDIF